MEYKYVLYEKKGPVVTITLNRPERRNSTSWEMLRDFFMAFQEFEDDAEARVNIITANGDAFCVGRDHRDTAEMAEMNEEQIATVLKGRERWTSFLLKPLNSGKPIITAIGGYALGGGFGLAMLGLLRVAADSARFQLPEMRVNLMRGYDLAQTQGIPFCVAAELAVGRRISAQRAYEVGLVNTVVPDAELIPTAMEMAEYIAELPPLALKYTMDGLQRARVIDQSLVELNALRTEILKGTEDAKEAARAFVEKRKPIFKGK